MRLPVDWVNELAGIDSDPEHLARTLTMAGLEVEDLVMGEGAAVLDIKVTPNRGDCLSVVGVAREASAAAGRALAARTETDSTPLLEAPGFAGVTIEAPDLCPRYAAAIVRDARVGASPEWLQARLTACGMRPINLVVDVTNYVMLETGQPLHAFDLSKLAGGRVIVRRARPGEGIRTLDGLDRVLSTEMLAICDADRPIAVAGVMGGADTEIGDETTDILLESAHFDWVSVRRTSRTLKLRTEASYRFERSVDPAGVVAALSRAVALLTDLGAGRAEPGVADLYPGMSPARRLRLRAGRTAAMLGFALTDDEQLGALRRLGFEVSLAPDCGVDVIIPTWRPDIVREIDLVEEIGRVIGYDRIPERLPGGTTTQGGDSELGRLGSRVRTCLAGMGLQEVVCHTLAAPSPLDDPCQRIGVRSALSAELSGLRSSLLPGLADCAAANLRRRAGGVAIFEVGRLFRPGPEGPVEELASGGLLLGSALPAHWQRPGAPGRADFYAIKGVAEGLFAALGAGQVQVVASSDTRFHPGRQARLLVDGDLVGILGELHPDVLRELGLKERAVVFEAVLRPEVGRAAARRFAVPAVHPPVLRDLAPRVAEDIPWATVEAITRRSAPEILESLLLTDVFSGDPLPAGRKSVTLSLVFRASGRTLNDAEVDAALRAIRDALEAGCGAEFVA